MSVLDTDNDGVDDNKDFDDENDGIPDLAEQYSTEDTDVDGLRDYIDLDSDNDGIADVVEAGSNDVDNDGIIDNFVDVEPRNGLNDSVDPDEGGTPLPLPDTDADEMIDCRDLDSDNDTIPDVIEAGGKDVDSDGIIDNFVDIAPRDGLNDSGPLLANDTDCDGLRDYIDLDSDDDTIPDEVEAGSDPYNPADTDCDGLRDYIDLDSDDDTIPDEVEAGSDPKNPVDTDFDGVPDYLDLDSDDDTIPDEVEAGSDPKNPIDTDSDETPDYLDLDSDEDTIPDGVEASSDPDNPVDTDSDGTPDYLDPDSDDDTIPDEVEAGSDPDNPVDTDEDGTPDYLDLDSDDDTIPDEVEAGSDPDNPVDTDSDGTPDYLDLDSDDDTIPDEVEAGSDPGNPVDTDSDGTPDYLDLDSDDDTIPDEVEAGSDPSKPVDTDCDGTPDYLDLDSDDDYLNDTREAWWLCSRTDPDTNGDHINDSASVDPDNPDRTYPYKSEDVNRDNDVDGDGLPDAAEKYEVGTDFKIFSTDGDPYGDGQEYFHVNMPEIPVADSPFVAAYPALSVRLSRIKVAPIGEITSTTGGSKQDAWSITLETSDSHRDSFEWGLSEKLSAEYTFGLFGGWKIGGELGAHQTWVDEDTHTTTNTNTESGFTQKDWSTAVTTRPNEAAKLALTLSVKNGGTAPAEAIVPNVNIKLDEREIATITSPTTITSLDMGETSAKFVVDQGLVGNRGVDITVSLDQLKSIDTGAPLNIEAFQIDSKVKRWDGENGEWICVGEDFGTYMREIDERCATLMFELENGVYKEYKVCASSSTLGDAFNWTINRDESIPLQNSTEWEMGFYPEDAYRHLNETLNQGKNLTDLKLKPGWKIIMTLPKGGGPVIHWAMYGEDMRSVKASVTDNNFSIDSVVAHVKIGESFVDLNMTDENNTIYTVESPDIMVRDESACIVAINVNNTSSQLPIESLPAEVKPPLEDGWYIISEKHNLTCMEGQVAGPLNVIQNVGHGYLNQRWYLENLGYGRYRVRNNNTVNYCPADVNESNCTGENVTSVGVFLLEVDRGREVAGANVQLKEVRQETGPLGPLEKYYVDYLEAVNETYRQFYFEPVGSEEGYYKIGVIHSGKYLTVDGSSKESGSSVIQENYTGDDHQKWMVQPLESYPSMLLEDPEHLLLNTYLILANHSKMALSEESLIIQTVPYSAKGWMLKPVGNGYFEIKNKGYCLTSSGIGSIFLEAPSGKDNQKWQFVAAGDGYYQIISKSSDECLTVEGASMSEGSNIRTHDYRGYDHQRWTLRSTEDVAEGKVGFAYLYDTQDYAGAVKVLDKDADDLGEFDNNISSLKISKGWAVVLYDDKDYDGVNKIYIGDAYSLGNFDDKADSVKLVRIKDLGWFRIKSVWSINHNDKEIYLYGDGYESGGDPAEVDLSSKTGNETIWKLESPNNEWNSGSWYRIVNKYSMENKEKDEYALYGDGDESPRTEEVDLTAEINSECAQWRFEFNGGYYGLKNKGPSDECYLEGEAGSGTGSYDEVEMEEGESPDNEKVQWMFESTV